MPSSLLIRSRLSILAVIASATLITGCASEDSASDENDSTSSNSPSTYDGLGTLTISGLTLNTDVPASSLMNGGFNVIYAYQNEGKFYGVDYSNVIDSTQGYFTYKDGIVSGESDDSEGDMQVLINGAWADGSTVITPSSTNSLQLEGIFTSGGNSVSLGYITATSADISGSPVATIIESEFDAYLDGSSFSAGAKVFAASLNNTGGIYSRTIHENETAYVYGCWPNCTISQVSDLINPSNDFSSIVNNSQTSKTSFNDGYSGTYKSVSNYFDFAFFDNGKVLVWDEWESDDVYILNYSQKILGGESVLEITDNIEWFDEDGEIPFFFVSELDGIKKVFRGYKNIEYTDKVIAVNSIARQDILKSFKAKSETHPNLFNQTTSW